MPINYILLDAANTLIHKPSLWINMTKVLEESGYIIDLSELKMKHKIISELIQFPDVTSEKFYNTFNKELLLSMGILPTDSILSKLFHSCKYLPWEIFDDIHYLSEVNLPIGVLSNFNSSLTELLKNKIPEIKFKHIIISETEGVSKPNSSFYQKAIEKIGLQPNEILYIGDSLKLDIEPAIQIGFEALLIDRNSYYKLSKQRIESFKEIITISNK